MDSGEVTVSLQSVTTDCLTEIGYETGTYSETIANRGSTLTGNATIVGNSTIVGGAPKKLQGNYLVVIRKISGRWLIVELASVPQQPAPATR
jgi:type V secretory pathway adhesin AidA